MRMAGGGVGSDGGDGNGAGSDADGGGVRMVLGVIGVVG